MATFPTVARSRLVAAATFALLTACQGGDAPTSPSSPAFATGGTPDILVSTTADDGPGSLRAAIADVQDGGVIGFEPALAGRAILLATELTIAAKSVTIDAPSGDGITLDGGGLTRIFSVQTGAGLVLRNATVTGGRSIHGAIFTFGTLVLDHSTLTGNRSIETGSSGDGYGGAINHGRGALTLLNSTVSGNYAEQGGGGIGSQAPDGSITIVHSTIAGNTGEDFTGGLHLRGREVAVTLRNSIIAGNSSPSGANCNFMLNQDLQLIGTNVFGDASCTPRPEDIVAADPMLGPLADNGGPTMTRALLAGSPAIETATQACADVAVDQRYVARPQGAQCDVGAYEFSGFVKPPLSVDASVTVNPSTGVAIASGSITCAAPATLMVKAALRQSQKLGRVNIVAEATGETVVTCGGVRPWSVALAIPGGGFKNGSGTVIAQTKNAPAYLQAAETTRAVKMIWGRK